MSSTPTTDPIATYHAEAASLARRYESLRAEEVHAGLADLVPRGPGLVLNTLASFEHV